MVVFRSKSGGAHVFIFVKEFVSAKLMRIKLKAIAELLGYHSSEIFPKQDYIRVDRGDTGSFLNIPYHANERTVRYAYDLEGNVLKLDKFIEETSLFSVEQRVGWVCGLGHGVLKTTPEDNIRLFVKKIRESFA